MPGAGDLVTVLSLEDFEFRTGLRNAANDAKKFGADVAAAGDQASGAIGGLKNAFKEGLSGLAQGGAMKGATGALESLNAAITGSISMLGPWGFAIGTAAGVLGSELIRRLNEGSEAAKQFAEDMEASTRAIEKLLAAENEARGFGRSVETLKRTGTVEDVTRAQEANRARMQEAQAGLRTWQGELDRRLEAARAMGGLEGPEGTGVYKEGIHGEKILQGPTKNAVVIEKIVGEAAAKGIMEAQTRMTDFQTVLKVTTDRAKALNDAMADPKAREEQEKRNKVWQDWSEQIQHDMDEIERLRQANLTPAEKTEEEIRRLTALKERNPGFAAIIDQAIAGLQKPAAVAEIPAGPVGAAQRGSAEAYSAIFAAMRSQDSPQQKTNDLLKEEVDNSDQMLTKMDQLKSAVENIGLVGAPL
jgi:hypothetical protein